MTGAVMPQEFISHFLPLGWTFLFYRCSYSGEDEVSGRTFPGFIRISHIECGR